MNPGDLCNIKTSKFICVSGLREDEVKKIQALIDTMLTKGRVPPMDATARGDAVAAYVRNWYEKHREGVLDRVGANADKSGTHADEFMLKFVNTVHEAEEYVDTQWAMNFKIPT